MINVLAKLTTNDHQVPMSGTIDEVNRKLVLYCQLTDLPASVMRNSHFFYGRPFIITLIDTEAKPYTLYDVYFTQLQMAISGPGVMTLRGAFSRLMREQYPNQEYRCISFSFQGIEKLFPFTEFDTHHTETVLSFSILRAEPVEQQLSEELKCAVQSTVNGPLDGKLYDLSLTQHQRIWINSETSKTVDEWVEILSRIKGYFEFILEQEIEIRNVFFSKEQMERGHYPNSTLLADTILIPKSYLKEIKENPYRGNIDDLLSGLAGWYRKYEEYNRVIEIWQKTIYNLNVSAEDLFIWRTQAFELLCSIHRGIHSKAMALKADNQRFPNLKNNLMAAIDEFGFGNNHEQYCTDAKNLRDYLTHNNPDREVDDRQKTNSCKLIHYYLRKTMAAIFGIENLGHFLGLLPPQTAEGEKQ